ncbi:hypothetical protein RHSIM_Rhsim11G0152400 [Rhododendron simsii]|uniref:Rhodopsin n=1 Tax=Rhododendron simsii TaxID=118357 RepID=A0A834L9P9_RHOSS|nr:hypothetical protein RHSIM_Rhsim11G0152400 [Rhododendron simsii]
MSYYNQQQPPVGVPPPQGYPPEGYAKDAYPPPGYPPQGYPQPGYPPQGYPPQGGYPPQYAPQYAQPPPTNKAKSRVILQKGMLRMLILHRATLHRGIHSQATLLKGTHLREGTLPNMPLSMPSLPLNNSKAAALINRSELCSRVCEGSTRSGIWVVAWWVGNWYWVTFRGDGGNWKEMRLTESRGTVKRFLGRFYEIALRIKVNIRICYEVQISSQRYNHHAVLVVRLSHQFSNFDTPHRCSIAPGSKRSVSPPSLLGLGFSNQHWLAYNPNVS